MEQFVAELHRRVPLSEDEADYIRRNLPRRTFTKGEFLLRQGEVSRAFYFNLSGLVRMFYLKQAEEKTAWFYPENVFISAYESFLRQTPAQMTLQAVETTEVVEIGPEAAEKMLALSPRFEALARLLMEEEMIMYQQIIASFVTQTPEERYSQLLARWPEIFQRVPQHYIASFIGVTPETLSRIKRRQYRRKS